MGVVEAQVENTAARPPVPVWELVLGIGVFAAVALALALSRIHLARYPVDMAVYREAGRVVLHHGNPYTPAFGQNLRVPLPFTYPPFAALAAVPLALLRPDPALAVWTAISFAALFAMVWIAFRPPAERLPALRGLAVGAIGAIIVLTVPVAQTISFGQVNLPLALACLYDCMGTGRRRGVLVGVATAIKLTPGLFIVYLAATRQWAAAIRAALTLAVCELLAALVLPGASRQYWFHLLWDTKRPGDPSFFPNQSLLGAFDRLHLPNALWLVAALAVVAFGLWRAVLAHRAGQELAAVALVGLTILLVSPISWEHHGVWLVIVFGVLAAWAATPAEAVVALAALAVFLFPVPTIGSHLAEAHRSRALVDLVENGFTLAWAALLVGLAAVVPHSRPGKVPRPGGTG